MVLLNSNAVDEAYLKFHDGLNDLTYERESKHISKACLICDRLLEWNDTGVILTTRLKNLQSRFQGEPPVFQTENAGNMKSYYTYKGNGSEPRWMNKMYLSPRGFYREDEAGFQCCKRCVKLLDTKVRPCRITLPRFAIANGAVFGEAPPVLTVLNDAELALVSLARANKHVFAFYGGAHKSMRGWHNLYENDVEGIARTLNQVSEYGGGNVILCILLGPFTPLQKQFVKNNMMVRPDYVIRALRWLKQNNHLYQNITIPNEDDFPTPLIIDDTQDVEPEDTNIESRMEYTVVFPDTDRITSLNGGCMTKDELTELVLNAMNTTTDTTIISRPTQNRLIDYQGDALLRAFPLQFPYGVGLPPEYKSNRNDPKHVSISKLVYLQHLQHLSIRHFHRGDFILVLHNMYERQRAVSVSYLRVMKQMGNDSFAEQIAEMGVAQLQNAINRTHAGLNVQDRVTKEFLKSIDAVCKSMGHTNDAAKSARLNMLADAVRFGTGAVFLTVTPDDSNCLRIQIYVEHESKSSPDPRSASDEEVKADFDMSVQLRQDYPGLCAFDFQQITELMIEHILGWDRINQVSYPNGGAFGVLEAWNTAIEEQGRKTLHSHWILYVKEWSSLLRGLYSSDERKRVRAATELRTYVDSILSTKLFGLDRQIVQKAYKHQCNVRHPPIPNICSEQDLRNLRFKHGESSFKDDKFLMCGICEKTFSSQELVDNVIADWFGNESALRCRLRLAVKNHSGPKTVVESVTDKVMAEFMTHALTNLHASSHVATCFKKGSECRSKLPQRPCLCSRVHFYDDEPIKWWTWMGNMEERAPFVIETERHLFDVFMNQYHARLSTILGCNTNVQCGIGGGHVMYVTYYASKSTQAEDKLAYCRVAKTLYKRIRRTEDEAAIGIEVDNPFQEGYRRLLSAVLSHTESTVVSGPMAWFLMRNESRFLFSHDHAYAAFDGLLGRAIPTRIVNIGANTFVLNRIEDYIYRPDELEHLNWYDFIAEYDVKHISKANEDDILRFTTDEHPLCRVRGVVKRAHMATPLVSYLSFPNSSDFEGNILDPEVSPNAATEKFAKAALCLFVPFRDQNDFDNLTQECSYTHSLQHAVSTNAMTGESLVRLQNIQNCHNMMKSGRQKDILERTTVALPDPERNTVRDHDDETQKELENHIEMFLTELVADLDEDNALRQSDAAISLNDFRKAGRDNCGYEGITANLVDENSCVFEMHMPNARQPGDDGYENSGDDDPNEQLPRNPRCTETDQIMTKARLTALSIAVVRRHVAHIDEVSEPANGTTKSIQEWAKKLFTDPETNERDHAQQRAFEVIVSMFVLTFHDEAEKNEGNHNTGTAAPPIRRNYRAPYRKLKKKLQKMTGMRHQKQLIMFMAGAGGSGKTRVINAVMAYAKGFCKELNYMFDKRMIVVTALTGVAATLINGETTHSAAKLNYKNITQDHIEEWKHSRLVIIDEISFASSDILIKLNTKLQALKETDGSKYGNMHIIFTGDFSQLEPVTGYPLYYETNFAMWHDWVNCFIELTGQHRFKTDPLFGAIMHRVHGGCPTVGDIATLNSRVLNSNHPDAPTTQDLPRDMSYAVYRNADKSAINNGIFAEHIKNTHSTSTNVPPPLHTLVIRSDDLTWKSNNKSFGPTARHSMWSGCSDCHIKTSGDQGKFVDAFLKLSTHIPLMYTENHDVPNGIANGTLCHLVKVVLHTDVTESHFRTMNIDGYHVRTIDATKVDYLLCRVDDSTRTFEVRADHVSCKIDLPIQLIPGETTRKIVRAKINRFPVLINHATTGHKLQGQTKSSLCISDWHYGANWPYVVLSRVTSLKGLFLLKPLRADHDFSHDERLTQMLTRMRKKTPIPYDDIN